MKIKRNTLEDREHVVAPVVMLTVGVHNGTWGPLYYPADELRESVPHWNGRPVLVFHPRLYTASGNPQVLTKQRVGAVFNTRFDGKRLTAEAWLDVQRLQTVDERVLHAVYAGQVVEVSTGLFTNNEPTGGVFKGMTYNAIARSHRPDHLAILPDLVGACSIRTGCGLLRNEQWVEEPLPLPTG